MIDPLTITTAVLAITARCCTTAKDVHDALQDYQNAPQTLLYIRDEADAVGGCLESIRSALDSNSRTLATAGLEGKFEITIQGCRDVVARLDEALARLTEGVQWRQRMRTLWNEQQMALLLNELRGKQLSLSMLVQSWNMHSNQNLTRQVHRAFVEPLRPTRTSTQYSGWDDASAVSSDKGVFGGNDSEISTTEFNFDVEIAASRPYHNARAAVVSPQVVSPGRLNRAGALPDTKIDETERSLATEETFNGIASSSANNRDDAYLSSPDNDEPHIRTADKLAKESKSGTRSTDDAYLSSPDNDEPHIGTADKFAKKSKSGTRSSQKGYSKLRDEKTKVVIVPSTPAFSKVETLLESPDVVQFIAELEVCSRALGEGTSAMKPLHRYCASLIKAYRTLKVDLIVDSSDGDSLTAHVIEPVKESTDELVEVPVTVVEPVVESLSEPAVKALQKALKRAERTTFLKQHQQARRSKRRSSNQRDQNDLGNMNIASSTNPSESSSRDAASRPTKANPNTETPCYSGSSSANNPKLLAAIEDAIKRLILPELEAVKAQQKDQQQKAKSQTAENTTIDVNTALLKGARLNSAATLSAEETVEVTQHSETAPHDNSAVPEGQVIGDPILSIRWQYFL